MATKKDLNLGTLKDVPNEKYQKLFETFKEIDSLPTDQWGVPHVLGYFCKRYEKHYSSSYKFKFNAPSPSKCFEIFQVKKLAQALSSDPKILKEYIDWVFDHKVIRAKRKLTSISFMNYDNLTIEFKNNFLSATDKVSIVDRSTLLPAKYQDVIKSYNLSLNTYGDMAFILQTDDKSKEWEEMIKSLESLGFDLSVLGRIV